MTIAIRLGIVLVLVLLVVAAARLAGRWGHPTHPPIRLGDVGPRPGLVVFTSTDCTNCAEAISIAGSLGVEVREITWELEPGRFQTAGVEAVPLTAVVDSTGRVELLVTGVPTKRALARAVNRVS